MARDPYRTIKLDPDVAALLDRAVQVVALRSSQRVTRSGALDVIVRGWAQSTGLPETLKWQVLADAPAPCKLREAHLPHVGRLQGGRWWACSGLGR